MLMIVLDVTIVNVALPSIQDDLGFSSSSLAWVVNAYLIAFGGLLLLAGRLGDLIGRRTILLAGLAVFTVASLLCGLAQSEGMLVGARFVQGIGGAMTSAVVLGMIVTMFPEPRDQAKAIGVYAFVASAGGSVGLLLGGVSTHAARAAADLPLAQRHRREPDPGPERRRHVRRVLPGVAVPGARAALQRAGDRASVPARHARHGHTVGALLRAADHALRR